MILTRPLIYVVILGLLTLSLLTFADVGDDDRFYELFEMSDLLNCTGDSCSFYRTGRVIDRPEELADGITIVFTTMYPDYPSPTEEEIRRYSNRLISEWLLLIEEDMIMNRK